MEISIPGLIFQKHKIWEPGWLSEVVIPTLSCTITSSEETKPSANDEPHPGTLLNWLGVQPGHLYFSKSLTGFQYAPGGDLLCRGTRLEPGRTSLTLTFEQHFAIPSIFSLTSRDSEEEALGQRFESQCEEDWGCSWDPVLPDAVIPRPHLFLREEKGLSHQTGK